MKYSLQHIVSQTALLSGVLLSGLPQANGHYGFPVVLINGVPSEWWEFVRYCLPMATENCCFFPDYSWYSEPQVCGWNATKTGHRTGTVKAEAGSVIGFRAYAANYQKGYILPRDFDPAQDGIGHQGPGQAFMSKAPGALEDYEGDGDWFKIGTIGASDGQYWDANGKPSLNFTIPKTTPPGKYLVRVEHFNISPYYNMTQQFVNCAQVEVTGPGGGTPGPTTKFPGAYDPADKGIWLPRSMYNPYKPSDLLKNYKGPGPEIWTG